MNGAQLRVKPFRRVVGQYADGIARFQTKFNESLGRSQNSIPVLSVQIKNIPKINSENLTVRF